jgi:acyl-CoA reductase-like NAD-dependent aldehyde dehydrogenase
MAPFADHNSFVGRSRTLVRCDAKQQGVFYLNQAMPFGGVKASGHGRFGTSLGL